MLIAPELFWAITSLVYDPRKESEKIYGFWN